MPTQDKRRFLHAVYRVSNLDETIEYYKTHFGMKQLRYRDVPDVNTPSQVCYWLLEMFRSHHGDNLQEKYTNAFVGFGDEKTNFAMELTYNYGKDTPDAYDIG